MSLKIDGKTLKDMEDNVVVPPGVPNTRTEIVDRTKKAREDFFKKVNKGTWDENSV